MKRSAFILCLSFLAATQVAWAQPRHGGPGGQDGQGAQGGQGGGRNIEERRAERQQQGREQSERNQQQGKPQGDQQGQRMSPDERRALREQIRHHGRELYRDPSKR